MTIDKTGLAQHVKIDEQGIIDWVARNVAPDDVYKDGYALRYWAWENEYIKVHHHIDAINLLKRVLAEGKRFSLPLDLEEAIEAEIQLAFDMQDCEPV